jgi:hypothetical protein
MHTDCRELIGYEAEVICGGLWATLCGKATTEDGLNWLNAQ